MNPTLMNTTPGISPGAAGTVATALARPVAGRATQAGAAAATTGASSNSTTSASAATGSSTITANDFLTLLVSELKNQDPTQPTDPNAYISQLVGVNSLQQLISINQGLTSFETTSPSSTSPANPTSGPVAS